jgi:hypothetical protein
MKFRWLVLSLRGPILIALALALATLVPHEKALIVQSGDFPPVVCPGALNGGVQKITLPIKGLLTRSISGKSQSFSRQKSNVLIQGVNPVLVNGNPGSEISFQAISGGSTADALCQVGGIDQWFIGGSGGVTSQGVLQIVNSGLSDSTVQVFPYDSKVALAPIAVIVKANSAQKLSLASIVPGSESIALHVVTDSGRVSSFLLDHRRNGLNELGSSFVSPVEAISTTNYLAGLLGSGSKATTSLRLLVPGNVDANVHVTIFAGGGTFTPVGFDNVTIAHQRVIDLPLPALAFSGTFGIEVSADQPILAAALTKRSVGGNDFAWANSLTPLSTFSLNLAGASGQFFFIGKSLAVRAQWVDSHGKSNSAVISGDSSALFRPVGALGGITFTVLSDQPIYGGAIVSNISGGLNYLPLLANHRASRAQAPTADLRTLARQ